jgi:hypothetical protein
MAAGTGGAGVVTLGRRAIALLTLINVLALQYAAYLWITTVFPAGRARALTVAVMAASPRWAPWASRCGTTWP